MPEQLYEVAVIGAGPSGIISARLLREKGITDLVILERGDEFGGSWRDNHYPGLEVDIPSLAYQFSFARNPDWSRLFAPGPEIQRYLCTVAEDLGLYPHLRTGADVERQIWDDDAGLWRLELSDGDTVWARFVISAIGGYINTKASVTIDGMEDFEGTVMRPNRWDDGYDVRGKRIAVIGTGSSGTQIVGALSSSAQQIDVFQRTPAWVIPKPDFNVPPWLHAAFRVPGVVATLNWLTRTIMDMGVAPLVHVLPLLSTNTLTTVMPLYDGWCRLLYRGYLKISVDDPNIRQALVPRYGILAKRPVISSRFVQAFNNPTTNLITTPIKRITATGIETVDGVEHPAELIVMATGYELWTDPETYRPGVVVGRDGFDLADFYRSHGMHSYAGTAHPGLPNRWDIVGPQGFVGVAWHDFAELVAAHAVRVIEQTRLRGCQVSHVGQEPFDRWNRTMKRRGKAINLYVRTCNPGLNTYMVNSHGQTVYYRPQTIFGARRFSRRSPLSDYQFSQRPTPAVPLTRPEIRATERLA